MSGIYALSAVEAGYDLIRALASRGLALDGIIALSPRGERSSVSGFTTAAAIADLPDVPVVEVDDYRLLGADDRSRLAQLDIDILIVAGWQRLIPTWLIRHCSQGVIGLHGSAGGINAGRGRSPQNWALLMEAPSFELAAFQIDAGVDSGPVLATRRFAYTDHDDIASSYAKSMLMGADMIAEIVSDWETASAHASMQDESAAGYLPQRKPEDGAIDWDQPAHRVRAQVAALTRPYPGAFCTAGNSRMIVWRVRPIGELPLRHRGVPGEIVYRSGAGARVVRTADGYVIIDEYDVESGVELAVGTVLSSVPLSDTIARIAARHAERYPDQPIAAAAVALAENAR